MYIIFTTVCFWLLFKASAMDYTSLSIKGGDSVALVRDLYRPSDRRLSAKLVPTFVDRGVSRGQRNGSPRPCSRFSRLYLAEAF
jgi:hypothetical protein